MWITRLNNIISLIKWRTDGIPKLWLPVVFWLLLFPVYLIVGLGLTFIFILIGLFLHYLFLIQYTHRASGYIDYLERSLKVVTETQMVMEEVQRETMMRGQRPNFLEGDDS